MKVQLDPKTTAYLATHDTTTVIAITQAHISHEGKTEEHLVALTLSQLHELLVKVMEYQQSR